MDTLAHLISGFGVALSPLNLLIAAAGALIGTVVGLLPGLGPINGVAILMPLAFAMQLPAESSLILLAAVYIGCEYGGRISSILLKVPGDAGAIMTALDGHPMARKGLGGVALSISAWSSFVGSLIATVGIVATLCVLPLVSLLGFAALAASSNVAVIVAAQVARRVANFALARPAREILFTSSAREDRYKAKNFIDTVVYRGGDALSGWVKRALDVLAEHPAVAMLIGTGVALAWAATGVALGRQQRRREEATTS